MSKLEVSNPNYAAQIVVINQFKDLEGCDNVKAAIVNGEQVIVGKDLEPGVKGVMFPLECTLSPVYLSKNNLYSEPSLNADQTKKGFFGKHGRVVAKKFRGHQSDGYFASLESLSVLGIDIHDLKQGDVFTGIDGTPICWKFIPTPKTEKKNGKGITKTKRPTTDKFIQEGVFRLHYDTTNINRYSGRFDEDPVVSISYKLHGTSAIFANLPVRRFHPIKRWWMDHNIFVDHSVTKWVNGILKAWRISQKITKSISTALSSIEDFVVSSLYSTDNTYGESLIRMLGFDVVTHSYNSVASSGRVIKYVGSSRNTKGFYEDDIWSIVNEEVKDRIPKGFTVYGEIVGYTPSGFPIQGEYTYGCERGEHKFFVYRVTQTNADGQVFELSWPTMLLFCKKYDFTPVPELFYGKVSSFLFENGRTLSDDEKLGDVFIEKMSELYLDIPCFMCKKPLVCEGVVVRIDGLHSSEAFKHRSYGFKEFESKQNDKGIVDIETMQSESEQE